MVISKMSITVNYGDIVEDGFKVLGNRIRRLGVVR